MGRPFSPPHIHQKNIWTLSKFHKTTSECRQRTSGTQESSPLSSKGGRKKYKRHWACPRSRRVCFPCLHCLGSRLLCQELSEAGPGLYALPSLSHSGSGTQVVLRGTDSVGPAFCALPRSEQLRWPGVWWARALRLIASPVPAARFSGCTTSTPSQADVDRPESQEVLVSNETCLQFVR